MPSNNLAGAPVFESSDPSDTAITAGADTKKIVEAISDKGSFMELNGAFGTSAVTGLTQIGGSTAVSYTHLISAGIAFPICTFVFNYLVDYRMFQIGSPTYCVLTMIVALFLGGLLVGKHHANIARLRAGTEKKLSVKKH